MQLIPLAPRTCTQGVASAPLGVVAGLIGCIGTPDFAEDALLQLNRCTTVSWWSVFRLHASLPPDMPLSASYRSHDGTSESWRIYRSSLYQRDRTFAAARDEAPRTQRMLLHLHAHEIPARHRDPIYTRHRLRERLSIVSVEGQNELMAINLYRHDQLDTYSDHDIDLIGSLGEALVASVRKHLQLESARGPSAPSSVLEVLTQREREVCLRMLKGWTYDGIAADLGLSPGTIKTYRDRAFDRLGIHHRNELFALVCGPVEADVN